MIIVTGYVLNEENDRISCKFVLYGKCSVEWNGMEIQAQSNPKLFYRIIQFGPKQSMCHSMVRFDINFRKFN